MDDNFGGAKPKTGVAGRPKMTRYQGSANLLMLEKNSKKDKNKSSSKSNADTQLGPFNNAAYISSIQSSDSENVHIDNSSPRVLIENDSWTAGDQNHFCPPMTAVDQNCFSSPMNTNETHSLSYRCLNNCDPVRPAHEIKSDPSQKSYKPSTEPCNYDLRFKEKNNSRNQESKSRHKLVSMASKEQEYLSAKERWKKSGQALRRYIAEKLGFKHEKNMDVAKQKVDNNEVEMKPQTPGSCKKKQQPEHTEVPSSDITTQTRKLKHSKSFLEKLGIKKDQSPKHTNTKTSAMKTSKSCDSSSSAMKDSTSNSDMHSKSSSSISSFSNVANQNDSDKRTRLLSDLRENNICDTDHTPKHKQEKDCKKQHKSVSKSKQKRDTSKKKEKSKCHSKKCRHKTTHCCDRWLSGLETEDKCRHKGHVSSDEDTHEYAYVPEYDEIVRRPVRAKSKRRSTRLSSTGADRIVDGGDKSDSDRQLSRTTSDALSGLQYALPYLPERFRRVGHTSHDLFSHDDLEQMDLPNFHQQRKQDQKKTNSSIEDEWNRLQGLTGNGDTSTRSNDTSKHWSYFNHDADENDTHQTSDKNLHMLTNSFNSATDSSAADNSKRDEEFIDSMSFPIVNLEDPFNARNMEEDEKSLELCSSLLDLVKDIDEPFLGSHSEANTSSDHPIAHNPRGNRGRHHHGPGHETHTGRLLDHTSVLGFRPMCNFSGTRTRRNDDIWLPERRESLPMFEAGLLNNSGDSTSSLGFGESAASSGALRIPQRNNRSGSENGVSERKDTPTVPDYVDNWLSHSVLDDGSPADKNSTCSLFEDDSSADELSSSDSSSSDASLYADDEFECDCSHCQFFRNHGDPLSEHLDITQPLRLDVSQHTPQPPSSMTPPDAGLNLTLLQHVQLPTISSVDSSFDSSSLRSPLYMEDYDYLLMARPYNEIDWLMIDNTPLSVMLEDVIQQMLSVQPELLSEQAAPPAPSSVIESLPTVTLTQQLIDHHMCCSICLCPCELSEVMTQLSCQHLFHPICIQAWLIKSGTCPVCRGRVTASST